MSIRHNPAATPPTARSHPCGSATWLPAALALLLLAGSAPPARAAHDEIGGDDVRIAILSTVELTDPAIDIAENGDIYVAASVELAGGHGIYIYRSQNGGDAWNLWGIIDSTGVDYDRPSLHVAEGTTSRLYVAYAYQGPSEANSQIRLSYSPLTVASATWTSRTLMAQAGIDFHVPCLNSDEMNFASYRLYVVAAGATGTRSDIWFTRSTTYGSTWESAYALTTASSTIYYTRPTVCYGRAGAVHCAWELLNGTSYDGAVRYRRALNYAAAGLADWEAIHYLTATSDGYDEWNVTLAASHSGNSVVLGYMRSSGAYGYDPALHSSADAGVTWAGADYVVLDDVNVLQVLSKAGTGDFLFSGSTGRYEKCLLSAPDETPFALTSPASWTDRTYSSRWATAATARRHDYDASRGYRQGMVWQGENGSGADTLYFDAEWRTDPGYPNLEAGFPRALSSGVVAPPALCELDGDVESEIVFGDAAGYIHAVNHDGTELPGWPVDIGTFQADATIAVGDITGNGDNEVVAGNDAGYIHALDAHGVALAGWPRYIGVNAPVYVALGAITTSARQVVACGGSKVLLYHGSGSPVPNWPRSTAGNVTAAPAIGDIDGDGDREIVILQNQFMDAFRGDGTVQAFRNFTADGQTFSNAPTLADLDLDGDLEIMAPSDQGRLYVLNANGTDYPGGWPYDEPLGSRLTSVALAQIRAGLEPEIVFGVEDPNHPQVHAFYETADELGGWPNTLEMDWYLYAAPIIDILDEGSPDVVVSSRAMAACGWDNFGADLPGWPRDMGTRVHVSAASGDIDADGRLEVVFCGYSPARLVVFDMGATVDRSSATPWRWWPMYGYNALRQGCLACDADAVTAVEDAAARPTLNFAPPAPNPARGAVTLHFDLPAAAAIRLDVLDVQGRLVAHLLKSELPAGPHDITWNPRQADAPVAGVYYLRLGVAGTAAERALVRKVVLMP